MGSNTRIRVLVLFLGPALGAIVVFFVVPVLAAFIMSFTDFDIYSLGDLRYARFVGLKNYVQLFEDPLFWKALGNTLYFSCRRRAPFDCGLARAAVLLQSKIVRFQSFFRFVYFAPVVTTLVAVAIVWRFIYHPRSAR